MYGTRTPTPQAVTSWREESGGKEHGRRLVRKVSTAATVAAARTDGAEERGVGGDYPKLWTLL